MSDVILQRDIHGNSINYQWPSVSDAVARQRMDAATDARTLAGRNAAAVAKATGTRFGTRNGTYDHSPANVPVAAF